MTSLDELSDDALTRDFRVHQRVRGHRYSIDDVLTAGQALERTDAVSAYLDLGSGIGSVALMVAWGLRERGEAPSITTVEAQEVSFELQRRNLARNHVAAQAIVGDFRDEAVVAQLVHAGPFDCITGTPPYFPPERALVSPDSQRAHARVELRGGVEAYLEIAARLLAPLGTLVLCGDAQRPERVEAHLERLALGVHRRLDVVPRPGKPALFSVWTIRRGRPTFRGPETWTAREADGRRSAAQRALRARFGLPCPDDDRR